MRKVIALALAVLAIMSVVSGSAVAKKKKPVLQHVEGSILLPQPGVALGNCNYRPQRSLLGASNEAFPNGVLGFTFNVDPKTAGQPFTLEVEDGQGDVDLDIVFYTDYGDPTDPTTAPANTGYETVGPGGEKGVVPAGFPLAFVCMAIGGNASFMYMTGS
jgi:energy-converting hydrogenase Eha subunit A